jgi:hypothetical protein
MRCTPSRLGSHFSATTAANLAGLSPEGLGARSTLDPSLGLKR